MADNGKLKVLDLFSGIGGFSLGLERTGGFETVAFCEIEPYCRAVLRKHWPNVPQYDDVRTLTAERLRTDGISVDVICGGFPCQDTSMAGKKAGIFGPRSSLWRDYARIIGELRPRYVIVENSAGLLARGHGDVLGDLAALRFDAVWHGIPASFLRAPHNRDRIWIVAYAERGERWAQSYNGALRRMGRQQQSVPWDRDWQDALREFRGMDDGLSYGVHRVDTLRNAVVPQIPEIIGRAILESLNFPNPSP